MVWCFCSAKVASTHQDNGLLEGVKRAPLCCRSVSPGPAPQASEVNIGSLHVYLRLPLKLRHSFPDICGRRWVEEPLETRSLRHGKTVRGSRHARSPWRITMRIQCTQKSTFKSRQTIDPKKQDISPGAEFWESMVARAVGCVESCEVVIV